MIFFASKEHIGTRVDIFLQSQLQNLSRTKIKNIIAGGYVKINDMTTLIPSKKNKIER